jgi:hypothetical protein
VSYFPSRREVEVEIEIISRFASQRRLNKHFPFVQSSNNNNNNNMDGSDEYFGTLGGSLMKDLLADLQVDDNDWSLEQLEKELASLDQHEPAVAGLQQQSFPSFDAASLVVDAQGVSSLFPTSNGTAAAVPPPGMGGVDVGGGADAWSLSLQNFTSLSLQDDFLAADSAKKQNQSRPPPPPPGMALDEAEDYDIKEKPVIAPPPGLMGSGPATTAPPLAQNEPEVPAAQRFPKTPQNSVNIGAATQDTSAIRDAILAAVRPLAEKNEMQVAPSNFGPQMDSFAVPPQGLGGPQPQGLVSPPLGMPFMGLASHGMVPMGVPQAMPVPGMPMQTPPHAVVVVGAAVPSGGPAWHTPHHSAPLPQQRSLPAKVFCNPLPAAPPIPATALETPYMSGRDIAYVVHSILKPVLAETVTEDDYFIQYLKRRMGGPQANPVTPKKPRDITSEMSSREIKSKEWASEKSTLGHVTKSNVARPRALIATPQTAPSEQDNEHQKQRANLWKARVYCDQAYQAFQKVVDIWRAANPGGGIPPQVQIHLAKLMKCMGIVRDNEKKVYTVDTEALKLLAKLGKGRALISRVLEQALLPPNAVQAFLPVVLSVAIPLSNTVKIADSSSQPIEDVTVDRLFRAMTGIILKLNVSSDTLVKCLEAVQSHGKSSISSPPRMECVHALLQKGAMVVGQEQDEAVKAAWSTTESQFMAILQGA